MRLPATRPEPRAASTGENQGVGMRTFHPSSLRWLRGGPASLGRWSAAQETFGAKILVEVRPVDAVTATTDFPVRSLLHAGTQEPRIPVQRDSNRAPIDEVHSERRLGDMHVAHALARIRLGSMHTISPTENCDSPRPADALEGTPPGRSRGSSLTLRGPARTLLIDRLYPREGGEVRSAHGCKNTYGTDPPIIWLARL